MCGAGLAAARGTPALPRHSRPPTPPPSTPPHPLPQVEYSKQLNESRIKVLQAREDAVQTLLREAQARLAALSSDRASYKALLQGLLVQVGGWVG